MNLSEHLTPKIAINFVVYKQLPLHFTLDLYILLHTHCLALVNTSYKILKNKFGEKSFS